MVLIWSFVFNDTSTTLSKGQFLPTVSAWCKLTWLGWRHYLLHQYRFSERPRLYKQRCCISLKRWDILEKTLFRFLCLTSSLIQVVSEWRYLLFWCCCFYTCWWILHSSLGASVKMVTVQLEGETTYEWPQTGLNLCLKKNWTAALFRWTSFVSQKLELIQGPQHREKVWSQINCLRLSFQLKLWHDQADDSLKCWRQEKPSFFNLLLWTHV